jgi:hypothetical protein
MFYIGLELTAMPLLHWTYDSIEQVGRAGVKLILMSTLSS